jgi:hypothetical protein
VENENKESEENAIVSDQKSNIKQETSDFEEGYKDVDFENEENSDDKIGAEPKKNIKVVKNDFDIV